MKYIPVNKKLFEKNRKKLINKIIHNSLVVLNSNDEMPRNGDQFYTFRQNSDMFYLSGIDQEKTILTICPEHPNKDYKEILFILKTNPTIEIWQGHKYSKEEASETSGVKTVKWLDEFDTIFPELVYNSDNIYLNSNENPKFCTEIILSDLRFANKIKEKYPAHNFKRLAPVLTELRIIKEKEEIKIIKHACDITEKAFYRILKFVKQGISEHEIEAEITHEFMINRANGHAYLPIVASGKSACVLHYVENNKICKNGDLLLMDFGAEYANYASDCSRTIPVNGKFTKRQRDCYEAVLRVFKQAKKMMIPGTTIQKINENVNKLMEKEMINLGLFTKEDVKNQDKDSPMYFKYYMHGTSHFIGLDVHDVGSKTTVLKKGMVLSCEPGIYIIDENIGIRIENDIVVADEPIDLMQNIPIEADEIEKLMKT
ncbi:MAG: aminopeptidase P N-terminal domain-containing protein [Bacteroidales bacterium]|nr:aminopeptidase P N-terminal domain-containing protein [Bacteroidales bacterium]